jgi:hypothetical protein
MQYTIKGDWKPGMVGKRLNNPLIGTLNVTGPEASLTKKKAENRLATAIAENWYPDLINLRVEPVV